MKAGQVQWYQEVSLAVHTRDVDLTTDYIIENLAGGLVLEDEEGATQTIIRFYVPNDVDLKPKLAGLENFLKALDLHYQGIDFRRRKIRNLDWEAAYRRSVIPVRVGANIVIKPPWSHEDFDRFIQILLEPKMAFGTGRHETTRATLEEMEKLDWNDKTLLDLGCGSGILSIYAAKRGASEVQAYDIDPLAIENCRENFQINNVSDVCTATVGSIEAVSGQDRFDVVVANIIKAVIVPIVGGLKARTQPGSVMILSGFLENDCKEVEMALTESRLRHFSLRRDAEWRTYTIGVD